MRKTTTTNISTKTSQPDREYDEYVADSVQRIEAADREAVYLLFTLGLMDIEGTGKRSDAIARLAGVECLADDAEAIEANIDAAFELGIAIGRRLGSQPLTGGAR